MWYYLRTMQIKHQETQYTICALIGLVNLGFNYLRIFHYLALLALFVSPFAYSTVPSNSIIT